MSDHSSGARQERNGQRAPASQGDIATVLDTTLHVFEDCRFPNGSVVVAPAHLPSYPPDAPNGLICEPGLSLAFALAALDALGRDERSALLGWVGKRANGFYEDGILRARYAVNGYVLDERPDRIGSGLLLTAIGRWSLAEESWLRSGVVRPLAAGLAVGSDRRAPDMAEEPLDALLAAGRWASTFAGLQAAERLLGAEEWGRAAEMAGDALQDAIALVFADAGAASLVDEIAESESAELARVADLTLPEHLAAALTLAWPLRLPTYPEAGQCLALAERLVGLPRPEPEGQGLSIAGLADWPEPGLYPFAIFWLAAAQAAHGQKTAAQQTFAFGLSLANADGHFPEFVASDLAPSAACPDLKAHLTFVLAASALDRL